MILFRFLLTFACRIIKKSILPEEGMEMLELHYFFTSSCLLSAFAGGVTKKQTQLQVENIECT